MTSQAVLSRYSKSSVDKIRTAKLNEEFFNDPYKHLVIDNFLSDDLANECLSNFPGLEQSCWDFANDEDIEIKYRSTWHSEFDIPDGIIDAVRILNSADFLLAASFLFKIEKLMPDPYFSGGGLNVMRSGGLLDVHVDGNYHDASGLNRRMNALLYLNPEWRPEWGGEFGVYDEKGEICLKKIAPIYNRLVVFDSHDKSFHGLPDPLNFPPEVPRRSIILYYYTSASRQSDQTVVSEPHSALWKKRNLLDKHGNKTRHHL